VAAPVRHQRPPVPTVRLVIVAAGSAELAGSAALAPFAPATPVPIIGTITSLLLTGTSLLLTGRATPPQPDEPDTRDGRPEART